MSDKHDLEKPKDVKTLTSKVKQALEIIIVHIPSTKEPESPDPLVKARTIAKKAARKAGAVSATLALPPGPAGFITVLPDIAAIWHIQQQMVADIAACFGKTKELHRDSMFYCLFRHVASQMFRDVVVRVGERILIKRASLRIFQQILAKVGVRVTQRLVAKFFGRLVPILGAVGVGAYAYYDTTQVAETAIELFMIE